MRYDCLDPGANVLANSDAEKPKQAGKGGNTFAASANERLYVEFPMGAHSGTPRPNISALSGAVESNHTGSPSSRGRATNARAGGNGSWPYAQDERAARQRIIGRCDPRIRQVDSA